MMGARKMLNALFNVVSTPPQPRYESVGQHSPTSQSYFSRDPSLDSEDMDATLEKNAPFEAQTGKQTSWITPRLISDATIGLSDGLTVPFALTAGLSALGDPKVVIYGGMAELFAGAISMGVGGYLGARSECQAYQAAVTTSHRTTFNPALATSQVHESLAPFCLSTTALNAVTTDLLSNPDSLQSFLLRFHHDQSPAASSSVRAYLSGLTIACGYFFGGLLPLLPYLFCANGSTAFWWSCGVMAHVLFGFGWGKTWLVDGESRSACWWSGVQTLFLGGAAALAAMGCVTVIGGS